MAEKQASIKWEIAAFTIALTAGVIGVLSFFSIRALKTSLTAEVESRGKSAAASMAGNIADFMLVKYELETAKILKDALSGKGVKAAFVVDKGVIRASSSMQQIKSRYAEPEQAGETPGGIPVIYDADGARLIDFTAPVVAKGRARLGTAHLEISYSIIDDPLKSAYINLGIITLFALILGVAGSLFLGVTITRPLEILEQGAELIGKGNMNHLIVVDSENEIGRLADAFNKMSKDLKIAHSKELQQKTMQKELEIAREIQLSIIPKVVPQIPGYRISAFYRAAEEVGGDYYDIIQLKDNLTGVMVADVSGKGVPAALVTTMVSSMLHSESKEITDPYDMMMTINTQIRKRISRGIFITAFYGILSSVDNNVEMVSAGHNETFVYRAASRAVHKYIPKGFPIAMSPTELFKDRIVKEKFSMQPGDKMLVFTDGITEAMNKEGKEFGVDALVENLIKFGSQSGDRVLDGINNAVQDFTAGFPQSDDIAIVVVERINP